MNANSGAAALCMAVLAGCSVLAGCGGGGSSAPGSTSTTSTTPTPPTSTTTPPATTTPSTPTGPGTDVTTYKNDISRSGLNSTETTLNLANVNSSSFGLLHNLSVDGKVDAQPLYLSQLNVAGGTHNVVFAATEHGSVYAFDANSGAVLWQVTTLKSGETPSGPVGCNQVTPQIGITSTPVIDRGAGAHGTIFLVAMSLDAASNYHQRLHALDVTTGAELLGGPTDISASVPTAAGGTNVFEPVAYEERAALLLSNGSIYVSFTSHCDIQPYSGWVMSYAENNLSQTGVLNVAQNSTLGPSIWMAGGGPAADSSGNVYLLTANGAFETTLDSQGFPHLHDFGNSFVKISRAGAVQTGAGQPGATLAVADYFALTNTVALSAADQDLGSGGTMLLPDLKDSSGTLHHLMVGAGKDGNLYVVNRDSMGKFSSTANNIYQQLTGALPGGIFSTPAYFNNTVYYADVGGTLKAFAINNALLSTTPQSQSTAQFMYPGSAASVSSNGTSNGIVWAHANASPAVLYAFDAANLGHELYDSNQAGGRDRFGSGNKFITPTIADGHVFVGTTNSVAVFGLL